MAGPGPQIGLCARLYGAQIVPETKNKENQQKQKHTRKTKTHKIRETSWPGLDPRMGCACAAESTTPIEPQAKPKSQTKQKSPNKQKQTQDKPKHQSFGTIMAGPGGWPGPARPGWFPNFGLLVFTVCLWLCLFVLFVWFCLGFY